MRGLKIAALVAATLSLAPIAGHAADDKDVIEYREHIMKTLNEQSAALGQILMTAVPGDQTLAHIDALADTAQIALKAFEPKVQGGESKPEVWAKWDDFSKRMKDFAAKNAEMQKIAHTQGTDQALGMVVDALSCKGCHDIYRAEKK